ncbi:MAG: hypothetical protein LBC87_09390 [Fibromonadaceae bacterium]|jgi:glycosyltransferase involved in cell wall biosynthesis|nr:hypothetical protein [Fibromonadaceae bacterium]
MQNIKVSIIVPVYNVADIILVSVKGFFEDIRKKLSEECHNIEVVNLIKLFEL